MKTLQKVLIVEADPKRLGQIENAMSCESYSLLAASNFDEALALINTESVSRIILGSQNAGYRSESFVQRVSEETRGQKTVICHLTDSETAITSFPVYTSELTQFTISRNAEFHQLKEKFRSLDFGSSAQSQEQADDLMEQVFGTLKEYTADMCNSIRYASKIQKAVLPSEHQLRRLMDTFVMNSPRNIVSGDFFWYTAKFNRILIAVADCTGHGVPGALLSIIGHDTLNTIVNEKNIIEPNEILKQLNYRFQRVFENQEGEAAMRDGMDIAIISIDPHKNIIDYAGARRPLTGFVDGNQVKIKGDLYAIGVHTPLSAEFTQHRITFGPNDVFYLCSDGFADQFGGAYNKKIGTRQLDQFLGEIHQYPLAEQKMKLEEFFNDWKQNNPQTDDVLVMGLKPASL